MAVVERLEYRGYRITVAEVLRDRRFDRRPAAWNALVFHSDKKGEVLYRTDEYPDPLKARQDAALWIDGQIGTPAEEEEERGEDDSVQLGLGFSGLRGA